MSNGYREYSEEEIKTNKKIAYLRTLGISVEDIRRLSSKEINLYDVVKIQRQTLEQQLSELENAKLMSRIFRKIIQLQYLHHLFGY